MAQAYMQNGGRFSTVLDIFNSDSLADMRNKIEQSEDEAAEQAQENIKADQENAKAAQAFEVEKLNRDDANKQQDRLLKKYEIDSNAILSREKSDSLDLEKGDRSIEERKAALAEKQQSDDILLKIKDLNQKMETAKMDDTTKRYVASKKTTSK
jgi:hypothetical protein